MNFDSALIAENNTQFQKLQWQRRQANNAEEQPL